MITSRFGLTLHLFTGSRGWQKTKRMSNLVKITIELSDEAFALVSSYADSIDNTPMAVSSSVVEYFSRVFALGYMAGCEDGGCRGGCKAHDRS